MKTSTSLALTLVALSFAAACSSSDGDGTGGGAQGTGGGDTGGGGGSFDCVNEPLDCIGGDFGEDANGCLTCDYLECGFDVCGPDTGTGECVGDGVTVCDRGDDDCGTLDSDGNGMTCPDGFACAEGEWGCACPAVRPEPGRECGEIGQACEVPSDLDCGPATVTVVCTEDGWEASGDGGEGGGVGGVGGGDGCG